MCVSAYVFGIVCLCVLKIVCVRGRKETERKRESMKERESERESEREKGEIEGCI